MNDKEPGLTVAGGIGHSLLHPNQSMPPLLHINLYSDNVALAAPEIIRAARLRAAAPRGDSNTTLRWRQSYCRSRVRPWLTPPHCVAASAQGAVLNSPASRNVLRTSTTYLPAKPERTLLERMADRLSGEVGWPHGDLSRAGTWKGRPPRRTTRRRLRPRRRRSARPAPIASRSIPACPRGGRGFGSGVALTLWLPSSRRRSCRC